MIAAAMMYEVSTQVIWSCVADSEPWMRGSATLAIVLSSACMIEASITDSVMSAAMRRPRGRRACCSSGAHCSRDGCAGRARVGRRRTDGARCRVSTLTLALKSAMQRKRRIEVVRARRAPAAAARP